MKTFNVSFPDSDCPPVELPFSDSLAVHLNASNSPLLFGCRTGICGTCLIHVTGPVEPPDEDEQEILDVFAPGDPEARLACQIRCTGDIQATPHPEAP